MSTYVPVKGRVTPEAPYGKGRLAVGAIILTPLAVLGWWWVGEQVLDIEILTRPGSPMRNERANVPVIALFTLFVSLFAWANVTRLFKDRTTRTGEIAWRVLRSGSSLVLWVGGGVLLTMLGISVLVSHYVHGNPMPPVWVALGALCILGGPVVALVGLVRPYEILRYGRERDMSEIQSHRRPPRVRSAKEKRLANAIAIAFWLAVIAVVVVVILQNVST